MAIASREVRNARSRVHPWMRDARAQRLARTLQGYALFDQAPKYLVLGFAQLMNLSTEIGTKLRRRGLESATGEPSAWITQFRLLKESERRYLVAITELAIRMREDRATNDLAPMLANLPRLSADGQISAAELETPATGDSVAPSGSTADDGSELQAEVERLRNELMDCRRELEEERGANRREIEAIKRLLGEGDEQQD